MPPKYIIYNIKVALARPTNPITLIVLVGNKLKKNKTIGIVPNDSSYSSNSHNNICARLTNKTELN